MANCGESDTLPRPGGSLMKVMGDLKPGEREQLRAVGTSEQLLFLGGEPPGPPHASQGLCDSSLPARQSEKTQGKVMFLVNGCFLVGQSYDG